MTTKEGVLELLEERRGEFVSGRELSQKLDVTGSAVWKAVVALRDVGYDIEAVTNKGYRLDEGCDVLSWVSLSKHLGADSPFDLQVYKSVTSTNALVKEAAAADAPEGVLIVAQGQTQGRGRQGRTFYSPDGTGVYFSLLLRPHLTARDATRITGAAAVAVCQAIESVTGQSSGIKWVNDVYLNDKKVCGILTEASFDMESGGMEYVVLGIGINVAPPSGGFPPELTDIAGSVCGDTYEPGTRERRVSETVTRFWGFYKNLNAKAYLNEYRQRSILKRRDVLFTMGGVETSARVIRIDGDMRLVVRLQNGETLALSSGEVRINAKQGRDGIENA
jgi:BirA family biotin operon repressor/biotin-[acetyl-CoA-carboxylase] ligase